MYILLGQTKRAVDHILLEFFAELYYTTTWAEFKNKKRSYLSEQYLSQGPKINQWQSQKIMAFIAM